VEIAPEYPAFDKNSSYEQGDGELADALFFFHHAAFFGNTTTQERKFKGMIDQ
jgi:hypothetical protein